MGLLADNIAVLSWPADKVKLAGFTTANGAKGVTKVRIDLEVRSAWELADLIRDLAQIRAGGEGEGRTDG